ncbi:hypothetical protein [Rickettsia hoogstraalii]|uniref:hypothetical protein n=1 Tax=Rickettsia hoogstraalii TaxID=467174 RepID=UPI0012DFFF93|nr:hypothetical protein [Rickettsia hoogstraalii]
MRGKTVSFDEAIQLKILIYRIFLIIFTGLPRSLRSLAMTMIYPRGQSLLAVMIAYFLSSKALASISPILVVLSLEPYSLRAF